MSSMLGSIGGLISAGRTEDAVNAATTLQVKSLQKVLDNISSQMTSEQIQAIAQKIGGQTAAASLELQRQLDPGLAAARTGGAAAMNTALDRLMAPNADVQAVQSEAVRQAMTGAAGVPAAVDQLVAQAKQELAAGATLPPDVQAELVKAGLEQSGQVTGGASAQGVGGTMLRTILGSAGLQLKQQRQDQAQKMLQTASNLNAQRQQILSNLFPALATTQLQTGLGQLSGAQNAVTTANALMPVSGISGSDAANIWLQRLGATNKAMTDMAQVKASGVLGKAQAANQQTAAAFGIGSGILGMVGL